MAITHLTPDQLIDLAEGVVREQAVPHLAACAACRHQLAELASTLATARTVEVPEPSPLFWTHFSERVSTAVAADATRPSRGGAGWPSWQPLAHAWRFPAAALVLLAVATGLVTLKPVSRSPATDPRELTQAVQSSASVPDAVALERSDPAADLAADASFQLVADLASELNWLNWDDAIEAGIGTSPGSVGRLVPDLSEQERLELQRLLQDELTRTGA